MEHRGKIELNKNGIKVSESKGIMEPCVYAVDYVSCIKVSESKGIMERSSKCHNFSIKVSESKGIMERNCVLKMRKAV